VEGCEALLPGLQALVARCAGHGVERLEVGMAHRGRLSVIHGLLGAPPGSLFAQVPPGARAPRRRLFLGGPPTACCLCNAARRCRRLGLG
jgi:2-oxoglutarate dehydrogenase E1 component